MSAQAPEIHVDFDSSLMFRHQVGGSNPLVWNNGKICKPLVPTELAFYDSMQKQIPALREFVPKFYGVTQPKASTPRAGAAGASPCCDDNAKVCDAEVCAIVDGCGTATPATPERGRRLSLDSLPYSPGRASSPKSPTKNFIFNRWAWKLQEKHRLKKLKRAKELAESQQRSGTDASAGSSSSGGSGDPSTPSSKSSSSNKRKGKAKSASRRYIVLEDLTSKYHRPSILDLKLGTRQHGPNDPPAKIKSKTERCLNTTSASCGMRLCGMQVYRPQEGSYVFRDKYFGRALTPETLLATLRAFFHDGQAPLKQTIKAFISRLQAFRDAVNQTSGYRFWSSSLLLVYGRFDRNPQEKTPPRRTQCRYVDEQATAPAAPAAEDDEGKEPAAKRLKGAGGEKATSAAESTAGTPGSTGASQHAAIDVRIIDFAHACKVDEATPDEGMLFGFDTLIGMLKQLLANDGAGVAADGSDYLGAVPEVNYAEETKEKESELSRELADEAEPPLPNGNAAAAAAAAHDVDKQI